MAIITLVGNLQARQGFSFIYLGSHSDCKGCKMRNVCFHLEEGRHYRITSVRDREHDCKLHMDGVRVVELEEVPIPIAIDERKAIEGSTLEVEPITCEVLKCDSYWLCNPPGLKKGSKMRIASVGGKVKCSRRRKLREAGII